MKIHLVIWSLGVGGAERAITELANHLSERQEVSLVLLSPKKQEIFYELNQNINIIQNTQKKRGLVPLFFLLGLVFSRLMFLRSLFRKSKPDLLISFIDLTNVFVLISRLGLQFPVIISERIDPHYHRVSFLTSFLRKILYRFANALVVQSSNAQAFFSKEVQEICKIIPNAAKNFEMKKREYSSCEKILTVGRLNGQKDQKSLILAFSKLASKYEKISLTIYGEGVERANLEALIKDLDLKNRVHLPGVVKGMEEVLLAGDLFVFPSVYEGFPNALCEAMALGLPVIASSCSGNVDVIRDGVDGRLFKVGDVEGMAALMEEFINSEALRVQYGNKAKEVVDRFSSERIYKEWDDLILELASKKK
ncbi:MAG: glycosyltransferase family 4 protein [Gammaproteobacteria bacterium]